jgi:hypothetical protein
MRGRLLALLVAAAMLVLVPGAAAWTWPADGPVLRPFVFADDPYLGGLHRGIDVGGAIGDPVRAPASGQVSFVGVVPGGGRTITIQTEDGWSVTLLQLGAALVSRGAPVSEGLVVASIGPSSDPVTTEPHVHLGIRRTGEPHGYVDPLLLLPPRATVPPPGAVAPPDEVAAPAEPGVEGPVAVPQPEPAPVVEAAPAGEAVVEPGVAAEVAPAVDATNETGAAVEAGHETAAAVEAAPVVDSAAGTAPVVEAAPGAGAASAAATATASLPGPAAVTADAPAAASTQPAAAGRAAVPAPAERTGARRSADRLPGSSVPAGVVAEVRSDAPGTGVQPATADGRRSAASSTDATGTPAERTPLTTGEEESRRGQGATARPGGAATAAAAAQQPLVGAPGPTETTGSGRLLLLLLGLAAAAAAAAGALGRDRMIGRDGRAEEDPGRSRLAVRERPEAHRARGGVRRPVRHLRAVPPVEGERRPDGERDRRAWDAGDGRGGRERALAA